MATIIPRILNTSTAYLLRNPDDKSWEADPIFVLFNDLKGSGRALIQLTDDPTGEFDPDKSIGRLLHAAIIADNRRWADDAVGNLCRNRDIRHGYDPGTGVQTAFPAQVRTLAVLLTAVTRAWADPEGASRDLEIGLPDKCLDLALGAFKVAGSPKNGDR